MDALPREPVKDLAFPSRARPETHGRAVEPYHLPANAGGGPSMSALAPARILVVEDVEDQACLMKELLSRAGYASDRSASAAAAIERLSHQVYDVLILDLMLPGQSGLEVLAFVERLPLEEHPHVLVTTALADGDRALRAQAGRAAPASYTLVPKPYDFTALMTRVKDLVSRRQRC